MQTTGDFDPRQVIGAVFEGDETRAICHLGTGSIIGDGTVVLTAAHVLDGVIGQIAFAVIIGGEPQPFPVTVIEIDKARDLALLRLDGYRAPDPLQIAFDATVSYNTDLLTIEYAQTVQDDQRRFVMNPAARRGHKTRNVYAEKIGPIGGLGAIELSFPALQGASGAPVMIESTPFVREEWKWGIVGVLVANVAYHAIPAQVVSLVADDDSYIEERRYMLPQGLAVDIHHLKPMYERVIG